jgi:hypothetical protein
VVGAVAALDPIGGIAFAGCRILYFYFHHRNSM